MNARPLLPRLVATLLSAALVATPAAAQDRPTRPATAAAANLELQQYVSLSEQLASLDQRMAAIDTRIPASTKLVGVLGVGVALLGGLVILGSQERSETTTRLRVSCGYSLCSPVLERKTHLVPANPGGIAIGVGAMLAGGAMLMVPFTYGADIAREQKRLELALGAERDHLAEQLEAIAVQAR